MYTKINLSQNIYCLPITYNNPINTNSSEGDYQRYMAWDTKDFRMYVHILKIYHSCHMAFVRPSVCPDKILTLIHEPILIKKIIWMLIIWRCNYFILYSMISEVIIEGHIRSHLESFFSFSLALFWPICNQDLLSYGQLFLFFYYIT